MGYQIEPGTAYLGYELGRDHEVGEEITVGDTKLTIAKILPEHGDIEDILLATSLKDAQEILDKPDRVNLILAIGCRCAGERLPKVRKQLETVLPETKIFEHRTQALARAEQRNLVAQDREEIVTKVETQRSNSQQRMERYAAVTTPLMILISAFWVGTSTLINVRERRSEIGLLRALGKGSARIAMLFLGKAILIGILGGLAGFALGTATAQWMGQSLMDIPGDMIAPIYWLLPWALLGTPLLCAMAAYLPTLIAVVQNPAVVLRDA
jgi:putative ABC transport system permease protein